MVTESRLVVFGIERLVTAKDEGTFWGNCNCGGGYRSAEIYQNSSTYA
jgi:hypothetical protein